MNRSAKRWRSITILVGVVVLLMVPFTVSAGNPNPGVLPPNSSPNGSTYGEWSARWWQWALGQPADVNPVLDTDGEFCKQGQAGPVWFLAGTFGGDADRSCTVPTGKKLFFPLNNTVCIATEPGETAKEMRACAKKYADEVDVGGLAAEVDGVPIQQLEAYRAASPVFDVTLPADNVFGVPADIYGPAAADGYYLMLAPLSRGEHVIHFSATGFLDVTYRITVRGK